MALLGMVKVILEEGLEHRGDCRDLVTGLPGPHVLVADSHLDDLAARCDLPRTDIKRVAREFATAPRAMAVTRIPVVTNADTSTRCGWRHWPSRWIIATGCRVQRMTAEGPTSV